MSSAIWFFQALRHYMVQTFRNPFALVDDEEDFYRALWGYFANLMADFSTSLSLARHEIEDLKEKMKKWEGPKRKVTLADRRATFERDGYVCLICGSTERLSVDHVIPFSQGGACEIDNYQTLCMSCNVKKRDIFLDARATS